MRIATGTVLPTHMCIYMQALAYMAAEQVCATDECPGMYIDAKPAYLVVDFGVSINRSCINVHAKRIWQLGATPTSGLRYDCYKVVIVNCINAIMLLHGATFGLMGL